ncbi:MAG: PQQ-binding-like beta-propeller repeat protein [Reichenbachiella sp.]
MTEYILEGNSGAEFGVRGNITAYDLDTGKQQWRFYTVPNPPKIKIDLVKIKKGKKLYGAFCGAFHMAGTSVLRFSGYPNLAMMSSNTHALFKNIVLDGAYKRIGIASFSNHLTAQEVDAIQHSVISEQTKLWELQNTNNIPDKTN